MKVSVSWNMSKLLTFIKAWTDEHGWPKTEVDLASIIMEANEPVSTETEEIK